MRAGTHSDKGSLARGKHDACSAPSQVCSNPKLAWV